MLNLHILKHIYYCILLLSGVLIGQVELSAEDTISTPSNKYDPKLIWSTLLEGRQILTSGQCEVEVNTTISDSGADEHKLEGSKTRYQLTWDKERFRVDQTEDRPKNPEDAIVSRTSLVDGTYRCIPTFKLQDSLAYEFEGVTKDSAPADRPSLMHGNGWYDPRLCGIWAEAFFPLSHHDFSQMANMTSYTSSMEAVPETRDGQDLVRLKWNYPKGYVVREFLLDVRQNMIPIEVTAFAMPPGGRPFRDTISTEWGTESVPTSSGVMKYPFPKSVVYRRYEGDTIDEEQIWQFTNVTKLNESIDPAIYDWPALGLRYGATVQRSLKGQEKRNETWNGNAFEKWIPTPLDFKRVDLSAIPSSNQGQARSVLFWVNIIVVAACSAYYLLRYLRHRSAITK